MSTYRQKMDRLADLYWVARGLESEWPEQSRSQQASIIAQMARVQPDSTGNPEIDWITAWTLDEVDGRRIWRGSWRPDDDDSWLGLDMILDARGWHTVDTCCDGYRAVWLHKEHRAVLTYCEGDLCVEIADTPDEYGTICAATVNFYRRSIR